MKLHTLEQVIDALGRGQGLDGINITLPRVSCTQFDKTNPFAFALEERDEIVLHGYYTFNDVEGILDYQCEGYGDVAKDVRKEIHLFIMQLFFIMRGRPCVLQSVANETFCYLVDCYFAMKMYEDNRHCHEVAELIEGFANDIFLLFCPHISVDGGVMLLNGFRLESGFFGGMFESYKREGESDGLYMTYYSYYRELLDERQPRIVEIRRGVMRYIMEQMLPKLTDEVFRNHISAQLEATEEQVFAEGYVEEIPDGNNKGEEVVDNEVCADGVAKGDELVRELVEDGVIGVDDGEMLREWLRVLIRECKIADGVCEIKTKEAKPKLLLSYTLYLLRLYIYEHRQAGYKVWRAFIEKVVKTGSKPNKPPVGNKHRLFVEKIKRLTSRAKE